MVYEEVYSSGNKGIWIRNIRKKTRLTNDKIKKIIKLENRKLIKAEKSIHAQNRKVYMLYNLSPAKSIVGGIWYNGHIFDQEFYRILYQLVIKAVSKLNQNNSYSGSNAIQIAEYLNKIGAFHVNLASSDIASVLYVLELDGKISNYKTLQYTNWSKAYHNVLDYNSQSDNEVTDELAEDHGHINNEIINNNKYTLHYIPNIKRLYIPITTNHVTTVYDQIPCIKCKVRHLCQPNSMINPTTCPYLEQWTCKDMEDYYK